MNELEAMKTVSATLEALDEQERARVLQWALSKFNVAAASHAAPGKVSSNGISGQIGLQKPIQQKIKGVKKSKSTISMDKSLDLAPKGKTSAAAFASLKNPTTATEKCVVAVYYLRETVGLTSISAESVYTFFKALHWPLPADIRNTLQQAGSSGWLDTSSSVDIKLTAMGENLVEHNLPKKPKT